MSDVITVLKTFRIIRIFRLALFWRNFRLFLETLLETMKNIASFVFLVFVFVFIYTLVGMEFFSHKAHINPATLELDPNHGHSPTFNFDNFLDSFFSVFLTLINDGQSYIFFNFYRAVNHRLAIFFWVTFVTVVQKIFLNLFLAMLL